MRGPSDVVADKSYSRAEFEEMRRPGAKACSTHWGIHRNHVLPHLTKSDGPSPFVPKRREHVRDPGRRVFPNWDGRIRVPASTPAGAECAECNAGLGHSTSVRQSQHPRVWAIPHLSRNRNALRFGSFHVCLTSDDENDHGSTPCPLLAPSPITIQFKLFTLTGIEV